MNYPIDQSGEQFTRGPWILAEDAHPYSPPAKVIALPDGTVLAEVFGNEGDWPEGEPEVTANAHLIAAAPDLYEALSNAREWLAGFILNAGRNADEELAEADTALAKACGQ